MNFDTTICNMKSGLWSREWVLQYMWSLICVNISQWGTEAAPWAKAYPWNCTPWVSPEPQPCSGPEQAELSHTLCPPSGTACAWRDPSSSSATALRSPRIKRKQLTRGERVKYREATSEIQSMAQHRTMHRCTKLEGIYLFFFKGKLTFYLFSQPVCTMPLRNLRNQLSF